MESDSSSIKEPPHIRFNPNSIILHLKQIQISDRVLKEFQKGQIVMLNLFQSRTEFGIKSIIFKTLKQVQGDRNRLFQQHATIQKILINIEKAFAIVPCHYADLSQHRSLVAVQKETETSYS